MKRLFIFLKKLFTGKKNEKQAPDHSVLAKKPIPDPQPTTSSQKRQQRPPKKRWTLEKFPVEPEEGKTRFHDLDLPLSLMHGICDLKFKYCTDIQAKLLPHTLQGKDATAKAQTGTGKSATFIIAIIKSFLKNSLKNQKGKPRALILAPTRELVHQIEKDFNALAKYSHLRILAVYGGTGYNQQMTILREKAVDVIVATPGRLLDFINKKLVDLSRVETIVLDEADRMLDMGFIPDVRRLIYMTPHKDKRQTLFFSATFTDEVLRLAESWTKDAVRVEINPEQTTAQSIRQVIYLTTETDKFKNVYNLMVSENLQRVLLFVNRKDTAKYLASKLERYGQKCGILSGDVAQDKRFKVLNNFKNGRINFLVATDVAARGLHIDDISHVINYDLPIEPEHYIHRIGRTGRAGATGTSISFADEMSSFEIPKIEEVLGHKIECEYPSEELDRPLPKPKPIQKRSPNQSSGKKPPYKGKKKPYKAGPRHPRNKTNSKN
ncbi:MAG: DEAD/DEAH box helicase [Desulfobacteraceae bacterium]|nr:DEAD/DEAH box helicase [Desulfobacteraceae bacterium]